MDAALKVTDVPEEACFADLVAGDNVLSIPLFQRPYRWGKKHLQLLLDDINQISVDVASSVFLGVILSYKRPSGPGRPALYEVVDGQQRVTTLYLLVMAAADIAARRGAAIWAEAAIGSYLLLRPMANNPSNTKLIPSYADRAQFAGLWLRLSDIPELKQSAAFAFNRPMPPAPSGPADGEMIKQFHRL